MVFQLVMLLALACLAALLLLVLFEPGLPYRVVEARWRHDDPDFMRLLGVLVDAEVQRAETSTVLTDGAEFYESELAAIAEARRSVHIEAFIFHPSPIGDRFLIALAACARRGVAVRVVVDAIGSFPTPSSYFDPLREAGGQVAWYQPIRWFTLKRFNNRSHRELIVVDGEIGFIGGAGIARHWSEPAGGLPPWRDTMLRVTGSVVNGLQSAFLENWLEATGEILSEADLCPPVRTAETGVPALVITGTPSPARASRARVLFQLLLATARETIQINSPYFLPDRSATRELIAAAQRNVRVRVVVPGSHNNHPVARLASRRRYGPLLAAGVEIHEYEPGMIHAKIMIVDGRWTAVGSTNFDSRSFELNDEVNLAALHVATAERLAADFERDVRRSQRVTLDQWNRRSLLERAAATVNMLLERQE